MLLAATPTVRDETFVALKDQPLLVKNDYSSLTLTGPAVPGGVENWYPPGTPFSLSPYGAGGIVAKSHDWQLSLEPAADSSAALPVGVYDPAQVDPPTNPTLPTINFSGGDLVGPDPITSGGFTVIDSTPVNLSRFGATFELYSADAPGAPIVSGIYQYNDDGLLWADADPAGGALTAALVSNPAHGSVTVNTNGSFKYTPDTNFVGTDTFQYRASAADGSGIATASIIVTNEAAPSFRAGKDQEVPADDGPQRASGWATNIVTNIVEFETNHAVQFVFTSDSDPGLFSSGPSIDPSTGTLSYTAAAGATGTATLGVLLSDYNTTDAADVSDSAVATFTITVLPGDTPPQANPYAFATNENVPFDSTELDNLGVLGTDTDPFTLPLTAALASGPSHGTVSLSSNGSFTYTPANDYFGTDSFTYTASDGRATSAPAAVNITVNFVNHAPSFTAGGAVTIDEDAGPQSIASWATRVSPGPPDEAGQTLYFSVYDYSADSLFSVAPAIDPSGTLSFTPALHATGTATLIVVLYDDGGTDNGGSDTSTEQSLTITIKPFIQPPTATDEAYTTQENQPLDVSPGALNRTALDYLYVDDSFEGSQAFTSAQSDVSAVQSGSTITVTFTQNGGNQLQDEVLLLTLPADTPQLSVGTYSVSSTTAPPTVGQLGLAFSQEGGTDSDPFVGGGGSVIVSQATYAADGALLQLVASFSNDGGSIYSVCRVAIGEAADATVLGNDRDVEGVPITAVLDDPPTHGRLILDPGGTFLYTPAAGFVGTDAFTYHASDGTRSSSVATVTLDVVPSGTPAPVASAAAASGVVVTGVVVDQCALNNGMLVQLPLADRTVFDDVNGNGVLDPGEPEATTDLNGVYTLGLTGATQSIRIVPQAGWNVPAGSAPAVVGDIAGTADPLIESMDRPAVVDVLAAAGPGYGGNAAYLQSLFSGANQILANSDTNVRLNLVDTFAVKDKVPNRLPTLLNELTGLDGSAFEDVRAARAAANADLAVYFTNGTVDQGEPGIAWELPRIHANPGRGYAAVLVQGELTADTDALSLEIGHLLGADNDPAHARGGQGTYSFARGYSFVNEGATYGDVMTLDDDLTAREYLITLPFYSAPAFSEKDHPLGDAVHADNALAIRDNGPIVQAFALSGDEANTSAAPTGLAGVLSVSGADPGVAVAGSRRAALVVLQDTGIAPVVGTVTLSVSLVGDPAAGLLVTRTVTLHLSTTSRQSIPLSLVYPRVTTSSQQTLQLTVTPGSAFVPALVSAGPTVRLGPPAPDLMPVSLRPATKYAVGEFDLVIANVGQEAAVGSIEIVLSGGGGAAGTSAVPFSEITQTVHLVPHRTLRVLLTITSDPDGIGVLVPLVVTLQPGGAIGDTDVSDKQISAGL